ncbi:phage NrS-1 polymerase family protein [Halococcus salifodinae]|uniref:NrS-1 polymerase-like HBD domain-containing protein n=1 Tax=Halococcus salifodinae DSM 8989 TaxID=1227456 RepID=M0N275_9EURY|nr:hypothetical protein [Halococcus salifodinae]EMA52022.1 hypothetical protein C450_11923 [Halococcus salifodinae DSM 8989]
MTTTDWDGDIHTEHVPTRLAEREQWICWREAEREGKPTKLPIDPLVGELASTTDPTTWTDFETAIEYADRTATDADGIGYVFAAHDPFVGVDLDGCRDPETEVGDEWAVEVINRLDSYTEVSPSGTGYHVLVRGDLATQRRRKGDVEMYDTARFFTVTGEHVDGTPTEVVERSEALGAIQREYLGETGSETSDERSSPDPAASAPETAVDLDDETLIAKATAAKNGDRFARLWEGNTGDYDSHSEADMALCFHLAFWTGGDQARVDRLFRRSGLMREKWDEVHYADGSTYGEKTAERAVAKTSDVYTPGGSEESRVVNSEHQDSNHSETNTEYKRPTRSPSYLTERNRLLEARIAALETTIEQKNDVIETLEAHNESLQQAPSTDSRGETQIQERTDTGEDSTPQSSPPSSVWQQIRQVIGFDQR